MKCNGASGLNHSMLVECGSHKGQGAVSLPGYPRAFSVTSGRM